MKFRRKVEITNKIEELKEERKRLPEFSFFGHKNWEATDALVKILDLALQKEERSILALKDTLPDDFDDEIANAKRDIIDWLLGEEEKG